MNKKTLVLLIVVGVVELISLFLGSEIAKMICTCVVIDAIAIYFVILGLFGSGEKKSERKVERNRWILNVVEKYE